MESHGHVAGDSRSQWICEILANQYEQCAHVSGTQRSGTRSEVLLLYVVVVTGVRLMPNVVLHLQIFTKFAANQLN